MESKFKSRLLNLPQDPLDLVGQGELVLNVSGHASFNESETVDFLRYLGFRISRSQDMVDSHVAMQKLARLTGYKVVAVKDVAHLNFFDNTIGTIFGVLSDQHCFNLRRVPSYLVKGFESAFSLYSKSPFNGNVKKFRLNLINFEAQYYREVNSFFLHLEDELKFESFLQNYLLQIWEKLETKENKI